MPGHALLPGRHFVVLAAWASVPLCSEALPCLAAGVHHFCTAKHRSPRLCTRSLDYYPGDVRELDAMPKIDLQYSWRVTGTRDDTLCCFAMDFGSIDLARPVGASLMRPYPWLSNAHWYFERQAEDRHHVIDSSWLRGIGT